MKVADIIVTLSDFHSTHTHGIAFDDALKAKERYDEIVALLKRRQNKENDLPKWLEIKGINELHCEFDRISVIALNILDDINTHEKGMREAFPFIQWVKP